MIEDIQLPFLYPIFFTIYVAYDSMILTTSDAMPK